MRPTRLLLSVCFVFVAVILTVYTLIITHSDNGVSSSSSSGSKGSFKALFSWSMPSTLFPQSAIISLTDDNSTFFLSRPAAFGPRLPGEGLSGQIWIGSGFSEDAMVRGRIAQSEGELGCSDIPGWDQRQSFASGDRADDPASSAKDAVAKDGSATKENQVRNKGSPSAPDKEDVKRSPQPDEDDGTDDHFHWPLKATALNKYNVAGAAAQQAKDEHADIQSLQESAEIKGKVVLLSRGGCGFLEKTKWVQRRGGLALIVGDNIRGGPLTTMYAVGDTSNISIPSVFTTRTTAHLLSSLIPGRNPDGSDRTPKANDAATAKLSQNIEPLQANVAPDQAGVPVARPTPKMEKVQPKARSTFQKRSAVPPGGAEKKQDQKLTKVSWLSKLGLGGQSSAVTSDSSRPPSSGSIKWIVSEDWDDEPVPKASTKSTAQGKSKSGAGDGFVIGVQDWRDPDMIKPDGGSSNKQGAANKDTKSKTPSNSGIVDAGASEKLAGGSHTPGSGIYHQPDPKAAAVGEDVSKSGTKSSSDSSEDNGQGWLSRMFSDSEVDGEQDGGDSNKKAKEVYDKKIRPQYIKEQEFKDSERQPIIEREGLWVTMTPTTVSTTPFFDTLLVLVVSPLVTLTIVYALLLLRSRIRSRRWRAPKSVVDRLPVRTYHTMSYSSSSTSSHTPSPEGSSPTSPLLQSNSKAMMSRSRPRSRTTSTLAEHISSSLDKATAKASLSRGERQRTGPKRYRGRQSECVVCLEEYVDGQSRVMSLPCGHEFHAECITPWLTTRRRTCPICKGDVVRSLNGDSSSSSTTDLSAQSPTQIHVTSDEIQAQAVQSQPDSISAAIPIPRGGEDADLERGDDMAATLVNDRPSGMSTSRGWRDLAARSLSAVRGEGWRQPPADRDR